MDSILLTTLMCSAMIDKFLNHILVIDHPGWYFDRRFIIAVVSCTFILPLCIPKKLKVLSYARLVMALHWYNYTGLPAKI